MNQQALAIQEQRAVAQNTKKEQIVWQIKM